MSIRPKIRFLPSEVEAFVNGCCRAGLCFHIMTRDRVREGFAHREFGFTPEQAAEVVEGLQAVDQLQMGRQRISGQDTVTSRILGGSIRYKRADPDEHWQTWRELALSGQGDCEDLAAAYAADLIIKGWDKGAKPLVYRVHPSLYHVIVWSPGYNCFFDPSRMAGMGKE